MDKTARRLMGKDCSAIAGCLEGITEEIFI
jgi:hypothetical protein